MEARARRDFVSSQPVAGAPARPITSVCAAARAQGERRVHCGVYRVHHRDPPEARLRCPTPLPQALSSMSGAIPWLHVHYVPSNTPEQQAYAMLPELKGI
jgi:hypothetical protein